jgi:type II secretory pathway pseudopilin PulG
MAPNMHMQLGEGAMLQQQLSSAAAAAAAMHSASGSLLQLPVSAATAAAAAAAPFYSTSNLWPSKEREGGLFFSAEHAFDSGACSGGFATAAAAAAAAASASHCSGNLPQVSCNNNSGTLPTLLEVIPAMSWLQLQQLEQPDAAFNAAAAAAGSAAVAAESAGMSSGPLASSNVCSSTAGTHGMAAQAAAAAAAAGLQEVELELNPQAASVLVGSLEFVKRHSGADVSVVCGSTGLQLKLCGSTHQIEGACAILRMLLL